MDSDSGSGHDSHMDHGSGMHGHGAHGLALLGLHAEQERRARRKVIGLVILVVAGIAVWVLYRAFG